MVHRLSRRAIEALLGALLLSVLPSGCGPSGSSSSGNASCSAVTTMMDGTMGRLCTEWTGLTADQHTTVRTLCEMGDDSDAMFVDGGFGFRTMNTFRATLCDRGGAVGGCRTGSGATVSTAWYYGDPPFTTAASVRDYCDLATGVFVDP
jgi:hypothetical protein